MARRRLKPLVAVTGSDKGSWFAWQLTRLAIRRAGGRARRLTPKRFRGPEGFDAFVIGGGADVDPALYGQTLVLDPDDEKRRHPGRWLWAVLLLLVRRLTSRWRHPEQDRERDYMELTCLRHAESHRLPVLGICRGAQLINVSRGGSLFQSIRAFYVETPQIRSFLPRKRIEIVPGSRLEKIVGRRRLRVNSLHDQSVDRLGQGLTLVAKEENGIVQAIERAGEPLLLGVQWHPEYLTRSSAQRAIFETLVRSARA